VQYKKEIFISKNNDVFSSLVYDAAHLGLMMEHSWNQGQSE
jgi:hypothetical protein